MPAKKYHLVTLGCQMNKSDSERARTLLEGLGFGAATDETDADFILINTCSVRQSAEDRVFGLVRNFAKLRERNPRLLIGVTGCMAGRDRDGKLRRKLPDVDLFFPTRDLTQLSRLLAEHDPELVNAGEVLDDYLKLAPKSAGGASAYVVVQTGCNKFCTYCVVPHARGLEQNRPVADILAEINARVAEGALEIILLGQAVNAYRATDPGTFSPANPYKDHFAALLWEINQIDGVKRIHYTAPHPLNMTDEVIDALALPKHVNYLHLPVQAGDDEVLRRMNRRQTHAELLAIFDKVKARKPGIALGTDIIVGFCGETVEQFERTVDLYREVDFDISYTAIYSPRTGTVAHKIWPDDVPREEKRRRWNVLQNLMEETALRKNQAYVGQEVEVLVDACRPRQVTNSKGERETVLTCTGNSRELKVVAFPGTPDLVGQLVKVKVNRVEEWTLFGNLV
jgi:tRNA-2-methylthio-N6-dimethylallyladenosine synthase